MGEVYNQGRCKEPKSIGCAQSAISTHDFVTAEAEKLISAEVVADTPPSTPVVSTEVVAEVPPEKVDVTKLELPSMKSKDIVAQAGLRWKIFPMQVMFHMF